MMSFPPPLPPNTHTAGFPASSGGALRRVKSEIEVPPLLSTKRSEPSLSNQVRNTTSAITLSLGIDMERGAHPRRKACIECQRRKIRCDGARPSCAPCVARGGEPCDFTLEERENRIANLQTQIQQLELALQKADQLAINPDTVVSSLTQRMDTMYPDGENAVFGRPPFPVIPIFPTDIRGGQMTESRVQTAFMPGGYGHLISRAELEKAVGSSAWHPIDNPSYTITLLLIRCFLPHRRTFHFNIDPHAFWARLRLPSSDPAAPLPALVRAMELAAVRLIGGTLGRFESPLLERTRQDLDSALAYVNRLDDFLWASTILGMYYGHTLRFLEAHLFYCGTVRFAVALGIHSDAPSDQIRLAGSLPPDQRRQYLRDLWNTILITDLWVTNAIGFTVVNGPATAVPIEHISSMDSIYQLLVELPQTVQQSGPAELRAYAYVLYCKVQSFCARFQIQPNGDPGRPRDAAFLTEYQRYSAVLSRLQSAPLMLQSRWGIAAQEVISPCNPDALYLSVLTQLTRLLLSDLLAQGGDDTAHNNCVAAAKEIARYARIVRSCGKPTGSEAPPGPHEIQAPFMIMIPFFIACEVLTRELRRPISEVDALTPQSALLAFSNAPRRHLLTFSNADRSNIAGDLEAAFYALLEMGIYIPQWMPGMVRMLKFLLLPEPSFLFIAASRFTVKSPSPSSSSSPSQ